MTMRTKVFDEAIGAFGDSQEGEIALDTLGNVNVADFPFRSLRAGRMFCANMGTDSSPSDFAKTDYDADQPQFVVDVPAGTTIVPVYLAVMFEDSEGTDNEIIVGQAATNVGAGTSTSVTAVNLRTDQPRSTNCSIYSLYTGDGTDVTGVDTTDYYAVVARGGSAFADEADVKDRMWAWSLSSGTLNSIVKGAGSFVVHVVAASTAAAGYLTCIWAEYPTANIL